MSSPAQFGVLAWISHLLVLAKCNSALEGLLPDRRLPAPGHPTPAQHCIDIRHQHNTVSVSVTSTALYQYPSPAQHCIGKKDTTSCINLSDDSPDAREAAAVIAPVLDYTKRANNARTASQLAFCYLELPLLS